MRVDASQVLAQGGVNAKQLGASALLESLNEEDDAGLAGTQSEEEDFSAAKPSLTRGFSDKSLAPFAAKLAELKMPVNETSARTMRDLMAQYPRLSMDEAAFLASNKIVGDESMVRAALNVLSGGDKTSAMIAQILSTLDGQTLADNQGLAANRPGGNVSGFVLPENFHVDGSGRAPFTELIAAVVKNATVLMSSADAPQSGSAGAGTVVLQNTEQIIPQSDSNMQLNAEKIIENLQDFSKNEPIQPVLSAQESPQTVATAESAASHATLPQEGINIAENISTADLGAKAGETQAPGTVAGEAQSPGLTTDGTGTPAADPPVPPQASAGETQASPASPPANETAVQGGVTAEQQAEPLPAAAGGKADAMTETKAEIRPDVNAKVGTEFKAEAGGKAGVDGKAAGATDPKVAAQVSDRVQGEGRSVQSAVVQILSEIPQFQGTPPTALNRFSNMLLRVAKDAGIGGEGNAQAKDVENLATQLEKMFTKIGSKDESAGMRLRQAREELFARLTLVQEEISRASQPMREQLLSQTQKLMDHVKLLNNIEQFSYMQLPVQMRDEQKTAELYVFKRKGGKRADPDNVNILLSIDLEFMGHWEALLNIKGKDVYLNMEVAGEAQKEHFISNTVLLHALLAEEGFKLVNTNVKISQEETTPLTALSAFDRYTTGGKPGKIDFFL